jgi:hypothetical protein
MLSQGHAPKIESKNKPGVTALREIAAGEVGWRCCARCRSEPLQATADKGAPPAGARFFCRPRQVRAKSRLNSGVSAIRSLAAELLPRPAGAASAHRPAAPTRPRAEASSRR